MILRRLVGVILVCTLALGVIIPTSAKADQDPHLPSGYDQAMKVLTYFKLVTGDAQGYRPFDTLTRGEVAKLATVGMAMGDQQSYYQNLNSYPDTQGHWAQGYIGLAKQLGIMRGYPDGTFHPNATVTYAEAIALMARVGGLGPAGGEWPDNWVQAATDAGVITKGDPNLANLTSPARRADVFLMLYRALTQIKDFSGMSLLQRRFKPMPPTITLDSLPLSTQDVSLTISGNVDSAESVSVNGQPSALASNHFQATVPLNVGVNKLTISATDLAGNTNVVQQEVVRDNTAPATITVTGPHVVGAGQAGHLDVVVADTNGAPISNLFNLMVDVPSPLGTFDPYTGTFTAAQQPAQGVMTFTMGGAKATWTMTVGAGSLVSLKIQPDNALVKKGKIQVFTLSGVDQFGNVVDVSALTPVWKAVGGVIDQQGQFAAATDGSGTVTAVVGDQTVSTKVTVYGEPAKIAVTIPAHLTANKADTGNVDIQVQDIDGNLVPDYTGALYLQSTAASIANPTTTTVQVNNGVAEATVQAGGTPGQVSLIVSGGLLASGSGTITVDPQILGGIRMSTDPTTINADGATKQTLTVTAMDSHGKPMLQPLNPPLTVHLVTSTASALLFDSTGASIINIGLGALDTASGTVASKVVIRSGTAQGPVSVAGLVTSPPEFAAIPVQSLPLKTVQIGSAAKLSFDPVQSVAAGSTAALYLRVLDANGNQITNASALQAINLVVQDQNGHFYPPTVSLVQGGGRAEYDIAPYKAGTYTFTATAGSASTGTTGVQPASQSLVVTPAAATSLVLSAQPGLLKVDGGISHTTITASVQDAYGNVVPDNKYVLNFSRLQSAGATGTLPNLAVTTTQGVARLVVPSGTNIGVDTFTASTDGLVTRNSVDVQGVIMGVPIKLGLRYADNNGDGVVNGTGDNTGQVGQPMTVYVDLLDNSPSSYIATTENGEIVTLLIKNLTTGDTQTQIAPIQYGTATFTITKSQATTYSLKATSGAFAPVGTIGFGGTIPDMVLLSGQGAALVVNSDLNTIRANPGTSYASLTVGLTDASGNPTINTGATPISVTLKASSTSYGHFTQDNTPTGTATDTVSILIGSGSATSAPINWYSSSQPGPVTIAASATGYATGTTVVTTKLIGPAFAIQIAPPADTVIQPYINDHLSTSGQDVKVTVNDVQGLQVNDFGAQGEQIGLATNGDSVIVAYYDYANGIWVSLDQTPTGAAATYPASKAVVAYKGQAWFRVRAGASGKYQYTATLPGYTLQPGVMQTTSGRFVAGPLTRLNLIATPSYNLNGSTINPVAGGGKTIALSAQFVDQYGNVLTNQVGTVYFQVAAGPQYGILLSTNAIAQNGVASAVFQSATNPLQNGTFQITAYTPVTQPGGAPLAVGSQANPATITITEDSIAPTAQTASITPGGTGANGTVNAGDFITVNFSEAVNPSTIFSGLVPGTPLATGLDNLRVLVNQGSTSDTISFSGLTLGTITLKGDTLTGMTGSSVAYSVSRLALSADGTQLTVVLGNPIGNVSPVGLTLSSNLAQSTFAPDSKLTDLAGNAMVTTPVQLAPASGF